MDKVKIVCRGLITDDQGRILLVKKTDSDFWSLPGGKLEAGDENLRACLIRELKEELGVESVIGDVRFVHELHKDDTRYVEPIWRATLKSDPILESIYEVSDHELSDARWFTKNELFASDVKPEFLKDLV